MEFTFEQDIFLVFSIICPSFMKFSLKFLELETLHRKKRQNFTKIGQ